MSMSSSGSHETLRWREMDSNHRYRIRYNSFWLPPFGPAIRLPQQKPALSCRGPMVRIHLPPARSPLRNLMPTISAQPAEVADPPPKILSPLQQCAHVREN